MSWRGRLAARFYRGRNARGRAVVLAAVEAAVAEQVPVLVPAQRVGEP